MAAAFELPAARVAQTPASALVSLEEAERVVLLTVGFTEVE